MSDLIESPDVFREERIPPRQVLTKKWPVLHAGPTPSFDRANWSFHIFGLIGQPWQCNYDDFVAMPRVQVRADMHCVTRWSMLENTWEGVSTREVLSRVSLKPEARFVLVHCEYGFTTNLPWRLHINASFILPRGIDRTGAYCRGSLRTARAGG